MKRIILLLLISSSAWAQQPATKKYNLRDFIQIEKPEDKEIYYNENKSQLSDKEASSYTAELAYCWLAKGNVERYNYYNSINAKFDPRQLMYLTAAIEKLFDEKKQYAAVAQITEDLLDKLEKRTLSDGVARTPVLMELNAAANAKLGNIEIARKRIEQSSADKGSSERGSKYFKDMMSSYYNRYAIVMSAAGQNQIAFDTLSRAFKTAESNPYMVATFRDVYKKVKGTDKGYDQYLKSLQEEAYAKYHKEVEKMYIESSVLPIKGTMPVANNPSKTIPTFQADKPVYDISMLNLDSKLVNLSDYKGKVLALDFWSTGCTPCVAAFAGFEKVVADYKKSEFQLFVVDLYEQIDAVKPFIAQKGIALDVLNDEDNKAYNVMATPTKIIFDPAGNIRFYSSGYAGSTDREYYKLKAMVEITKSRASKAPKQSK